MNPEEHSRKLTTFSSSKYSLPPVPMDLHSERDERGGGRVEEPVLMRDVIEDEDDYYRERKESQGYQGYERDVAAGRSRKATLQLPFSPRPHSQGGVERKFSSDTARMFWDEVWKMSQKKVGGLFE